MKIHISKQTNLFALINPNHVLKCYSEFKLKTITESIELSANGISIKEIYITNEKSTENLEYVHYKNIDEIENCKKSFEENLYKNLLAKKANLTIKMPEKYFNVDITLRIIYAPPKNNSYSYKHHNEDAHKEFSFLPFFPYIVNLDYEIESIYVCHDKFSVIAPGQPARKDKRNNLAYTSYKTISTKHIPFTIGTFKCVDMSQGNIKIKIFLPSQFQLEKEFKNDLYNLCAALQTFTGDSFMFKLVFHYNNLTTVSENVIFFPISIFPGQGIDQNFIIRIKLCEFMSKMIFINFKCNNTWLNFGIREYCKNCLMRNVFGENEIYFQTKEDLDYVCENDIIQPSLYKEEEIKDLSFVFFNVKLTYEKEFKKIKSRLVFHVLENNLSRAFMDKILINAINAEECNTMDFIKIIKDVTGKDMKNFFVYYVFKPGVVCLNVSYESDKKGKVDVSLTQLPISYRKGANKKALGEIKLKIHELEGIYEHKFLNNKISFQCHMRTRKRKTEKELRKAEEKQKGNLIDDEASAVKEEGAEQTENINPLLFIRVDPNIENIFKINLIQPDFMFIEQMINDKNVISQVEAIYALKEKPSDTTIQAFEKILNDTHTFYKIRILILRILSVLKVETKRMAIQKDENEGYTYNEESKEILKHNFGYQRIIQFFIKKHCIPGSTIPKPNDFHSVTNYLIQNNILTAFSKSEPETIIGLDKRIVNTKSVLSAFYNNIIKLSSLEENTFYNTDFETFYNQNNICNTNYLANLIGNLSYQLCSKTCLDINPFISELERKRKNDTLFPSFQNLLTSKILKCYGRMCFYGLIELNYKILMKYVDKRNFISVRESAIEILCMCYLSESFDFVKSVLKSEERHLKIFVLNILKLIIQIKEDEKNKSEEYIEIFNEIHSSDSEFNMKFNHQKRYKKIFENKEIFYDLLGEHQHDDILMELISDIIYSIENKYLICNLEDDEEFEITDESKYVVRFKVPSVVRLKINDKLRKDLIDEKKEKRKDFMRSDISTEKIFIEKNEPDDNTNRADNKYKIRLKKIDILSLPLDGFIHKYFSNLDDFLKKVEKSKENGKNELLYLKEIRLSSNDSLKQKKEENELSKKSDKYAEMKKRILEDFYFEDDLDIEKFIIFSVNKNMKKHKYYTKLDIKVLDSPNLTIYKKEMHSQFLKYYSTNKTSSTPYLNAKSLETHMEQLLLEFTPFESLIPMNDDFILICQNIIDFIKEQEDVEPFLKPVNYIELSILNYVDIVRYPCDIETVENKIFNNQYISIDAFIFDIERIFLNCMEFNTAESEIHKTSIRLLYLIREKICKELIIYFSKNNINVDKNNIHVDKNKVNVEIYESVLSRFNTGYLRNCELTYAILLKILREAIEMKEAQQFTNKIDTPGYEKVVKNPMYLSKILLKMENREYISIGHLYNDLNLLIKNCVTANGSTWVTRLCKKVDNFIRKEVSIAFCVRNVQILKSRGSEE